MSDVLCVNIAESGVAICQNGVNSVLCNVISNGRQPKEDQQQGLLSIGV
jgi:hypothetical protein